MLVQMTSSKLIPGAGNRQANIMIIGEAPSSQDERKGEPFVGPAGQLLTDTMHKVGILRSQTYITNVIKERPFKDNIKPFIDITKKEPKLSGGYEEYLEELKREIEMVNPNVIVAVGNVPLFALTGLKGVLKYRGSILESTLVPGKKVIPIIHPQAALAQFIFTYFMQFDFVRIKEESVYPDIDLKKREYFVKPTFKQSIEYLNECLTRDHAFDIEVSNEEVSCISFSYSENHAISIPFIHNAKQYFDPLQELEIWKKISKVLGNRDTMSIAQNASFDATFLFRKYGIIPRNIQDTMVAQAIIYPEFPKGLDFITTQYTDIPYYKDDGKHVIRGHESGNEQFWLYNAKDSIVLMEAFPKQLRDLERIGNLDIYRRQVSLIEIILFMTERGIKMDIEGMNKKAIEVRQELKDLQEELNNVAKQPLNPNSPHQLKEYFYEKKKVKPYVSQGKPTTNEGAMKRLARRGFQEASIILEMRGKRKMLSTYLEMLLDKDGRLRSSINPVGTKFGRLSSSKNIFGTGGNIQNLPYWFKRFMLVDEGYVGYDVDLSQAENRVVAYLGPEPAMIHAFETGEDIHSKTASYIFDKPPEKISREKGSTAIGNGTKSERDIGKQSNHSLNYRMGYKAFAYHWEMQETDGKRIKEIYLRVYPGVKKWWRSIENQLYKNRTLTNLMGRRMRFLDRWSDTLLKEATSFVPQSTVADKINAHGLIEIYYNQEKYKEVVLVNQVHDSIVFMIPKDVGWRRHAEILKDITDSLERPLSYRGVEFSIPAEIQMLPENFKDGPDFRAISDITAFAQKLEDEYNNYFNNGKSF